MLLPVAEGLRDDQREAKTIDLKLLQIFSLRAREACDIGLSSGWTVYKACRGTSPASFAVSGRPTHQPAAIGEVETPRLRVSHKTNQKHSKRHESKHPHRTSPAERVKERIA